VLPIFLALGIKEAFCSPVSVVVTANVIVDCSYKNCTAEGALRSSKEMIEAFTTDDVLCEEKSCVHRDSPKQRLKGSGMWAMSKE
jgi:hypothetical protein